MPQLPLPLEWPDTHNVQDHQRERAELEARYAPRLRYALEWAQWVSYVGNRDVPGLRLYRYKEAFSYKLVRQFLRRLGPDLPTPLVLDPFMGMGTTPFAAMRSGFPSAGVDRLPVAVAVAEGLLALLRLQPGQLLETFRLLRRNLSSFPPAPIADDVRIVRLAFPEEIREHLQRWKSAVDTLESPLREAFLLLFLSILEPCSQTAKDGQFLRLRPDKPIPSPDEVLKQQVTRAEEDVRFFHRVRSQERWGPPPSLWNGDARNLRSFLPKETVGFIITSPPYANRYDYTRTYSLELCFAFVRNFAELRDLRHSVLRSHIESRLNADEKPPHPAVEEVEKALAGKQLNNPKIPAMLRAYFVDMEAVVREMYRVLAPGGWVVMVVDNVRFEGEMVPVDLILSDLAERHGLHASEIWIARFKGNSSQQMRKYGRKPVRESILLWQKPA